MSYSLNELRLDCNNRIKLNFDGGELSSDAGLGVVSWKIKSQRKIMISLTI